MRALIKTILLAGIILPCIIGGWGCKGSKVPELGEISGPATVDEYGYVEYSISFINATGATFLWSCDPADAGKFDKPDLPKTGFTASMVTHNTPVKISVMVDSLQSSPVILSKNITVRDITKLAVGEIEGPDTVDEGSSVTYSITATDDTGIKYHWSANPDDLGIFDTPEQPLTQFTAAYVYEDTPLEIQVIIESDNYGPVLKKKQLTIKDMGPYGWTRTWGGTTWCRGMGVAIDGNGDAYVTGSFQDTVDFDPGPGLDEHASKGNWDIFLSKFDSNGEFQWARTWGGSGCDEGGGVATDGSGNVYVTGLFSETADFDPGPGIDEHTSYDNFDIFLIKIDANGNFQWACTWGGYDYDYGNSVAIDANGNAFVTGSFEDVVDFDPGSAVDEHTADGDSDIFLSKFESSGAFQWARTWGGNDWDGGSGVAIDGNGYAYVAGFFKRKVDFDPGPGVDEHTSIGGHDIFLSKFNSNGEFQWARTWGGMLDDISRAIAIEENGNTFVTGYFSATIDFDPGPGIDNHKAKGISDDPFLSKFDSNGNFQWARTWGSFELDWGRGVAVDINGNAYTTGLFHNTVDFDPGPGIDKHISNGYTDIYLNKFDPNGEFCWVYTWGGIDWDDSWSVATDGNCNAFVTGVFDDTVDFDPGPEVDEHTCNGYEDIFLSKFNQDWNW